MQPGFLDHLATTLAEIEAQGLMKREREIVTPQSGAIELKDGGHNGPRGNSGDFGGFFAVPCQGGDLRVFENRGIEKGRLLGSAVEPEERGDFLHGGQSEWVE